MALHGGLGVAGPITDEAQYLRLLSEAISGQLRLPEAKALAD